MQQTILIAGSTGNVGGGAADALARRGARVVLLGRRADRLEARAEAIRSSVRTSSAAVETLVVDLADMASLRTATAEALHRFPAIHGLILSSVVYLQHGPNVLPSGHEAMFAANVLGPFLLTQLLLDRLSKSNGIVLHVVAPFFERIDWEDLETIRRHRTERAYNRSKTMGRMIAAELAERHGERITSMAFDPTFIIDKADPELAKRWPAGFIGFLWRVLARLIAKPPHIAGEPIADLMLSRQDENLNGALFRLSKRLEPDKAMRDTASRERLWRELQNLTGGAHLTSVAQLGALTHSGNRPTALRTR